MEKIDAFLFFKPSQPFVQNVIPHGYDTIYYLLDNN